MKTLDLLAVATLLILSIGTFANTSKEKLAYKYTTKQLTVNPHDINVEEIEALKELTSATAPATIYPAIVLTDADFNTQDIEKLKAIDKTVSLPEIVVSGPDDINPNDIEALKLL